VNEHHVQRLHHRIGSHTAGIVTRDEGSFRFFSSDASSTASKAAISFSLPMERAARALFVERRHLSAGNCSVF